MKKTLTLVVAILLTLSLLTACGESSESGKNSESSAPTATQAETPPPPAESAAPEADDEENEKIEADYIFKISMVKGLEDEDPSAKTGEYSLDVDSTILFNSDEAANKLLSEAMGGADVSMPGLGVTVEQKGHYSNTSYLDDDGNSVYVKSDTGYMQKVKENWQSVIKDMNGKRVQPAVGSYMMFEEFTIEYEGSGGNLFYGTSGEKTVTDVYLFVVVEPDMPGVDMDLTDRNVKVYITFPDWTIKGTEIWLQGEGTLSLRERTSPIYGE